MVDFASLLSIGVTLCVGAISPGPSFLMVARTAASAGRRNGLSAALGMGLGTTIFATLSLLGVHIVFVAIPALYLAYLGLQIWRGAERHLDFPCAGMSQDRAVGWNYFSLGLVTQVSNPKTAIVYASVFAAFLPATPSIEYGIALVSLAFSIDTGWYAIVATILSAKAPRATYLYYKKWADRSAGSILGVLGLKLACRRDVMALEPI